jgi:hypothetical protein
MLGPRFPGRQVLGSWREAKRRARRRLRSKLQFCLSQLEPMERRRLFIPATTLVAPANAGLSGPLNIQSPQ